MKHEVFLDHFQTEQFGLYWRHYPAIGLNAGLFCNLLLYGGVGLESDSFYPDEVRRYPWADAFDHFVDLGKLGFIHEQDALDRTVAAVFSSDSADLSRLNVPDYLDVFNYEYCVRQNVPFCISKRRAQDIGRIIAIANKVFSISSRPDNTQELDKTRTALAEWLFDIEIPALSVRNERMRRELFQNRPHRVVTSSSGVIEQDLTNLLLASKWYTLQETWFISPEELVEIFSNSKAIDAVRSKITLLAERVATRSELADAIKMEYEELDQKAGISDWVFTGVGLALDWVPLPGVGAAATLVEKGVNYLVQKEYGWLLFMNRLNRRLRKGEVTGKDNAREKEDGA